MGDDVVRLSVIGQIIRWRWRLLAVVAAVGALLGVGASLLFSPGYESTSRVLLQAPQDEQQLLTEVQIATSSVVLDRTAAALGRDVSGAELRGSVSAEVLDGNVIEIRSTAPNPEQAQQLTSQATQEYVTFSTQLVSGPVAAADQVLQQRRETLRQRIAQANERITKLEPAAGPDAPAVPGAQARAELERLRATVADATAELDDLSGREQKADADAVLRQASITVMEPATRPASPAEPTLAQFVAGGALLFFVLAVCAHLVAARADRRLWSTSEIATALGAPVVGSVDVPDAPEEPPSPAQPTGHRRWLSRLRRLVHDDRMWDAPQLSICSSDVDRDLRYRRVLTRLRGAPGRILARLRGAPDTVLRLLVVVTDDDVVAHRAVARLAVAAGVDGGPVSVVTDQVGLSRMVQAAAAGQRTARVMVRASSEQVSGVHRTVLRVVEVSAARPTVPDCGRVAGALVMLTAGTRTAWELIGIAEACADAGYQVLGAFVTSRSQPSDDQLAEPTEVDWPKVVINGPTMAGSA